MDMEYPEEIYHDGASCTPMSASQREGWAGWGRRFAYRTGFDVGKAAQVDPLAGYSNLTAAISAGEPIDLERLDGLKTQCVHPELGTLNGTLERRESVESDSPSGWWKSGMDYIYVTALTEAWYGEDGWSLWVEGEVPMRRKTADELEVGTYFLGEVCGDSSCLAYVGRPLKSDTKKTIYYAPDMLKAITPASEWVVLEELGPCPFV